MLTGKTIGQLTNLANPTSDTLFPVELSGSTYHIDFSSITNNLTFEDITYSELYDKYTGATFVAGSYYRITDFQTCYDQPDYDYNKNSIVGNNYKVADIDSIIVFATSNSTLSENAYQPSYPKDSIKYDITYNVTERTGSPAKGRITERIDEFNNRTDYDHRTILFKRYRYYEVSLNNPYQGTVSVADISSTEMTVFGTDTIFLSTLIVGDKIGFESVNNDFRVFEVTNIVSDTEMAITGLTTVTLGPNTKMYGTFWDEYGSYYQNNVDDPSLFGEYYTFDGTGNYNNYIGNHANLYQENENDFILANNVFHNRFIGNKFDHSCYNNTFFDDCYDNNIGNYFFNNITDDDFDANVIGNEFFNNRITSNFQYNRIGENFYNNYIVQNSFYRNNIMNDFRDNEISGGDFQNNEIGSQFNNNKIKQQFYKNDIGNGFYNNEIYWGGNGNLIGNGFNNNNLYCVFYDNVIGEYFENNTLGDILNPSSRDFYENRIGTRFSNNTINESIYKNQIDHDFYNNTINSDFYTNIIGERFENNTIYGHFYDNQIFNEFKGNIIYQEFYTNKTGWGVSGNEFSGICADNSFGSFFLGNDFFGNVFANIIKDGFTSNIIGDGFVGNNIGSAFQGNTIAQNFQHNEIGSFFQNNIIDEGFGFGGFNSQKNYIGDIFQNNIIGEYFYNNRVGNYFQNNTIGDYFQWNVIDTDVSGTDFTTNYGIITSFTYTALGTNRTDNPWSTQIIELFEPTKFINSGNGVGSDFQFTPVGGEVTSMSLVSSGTSFNVGDTITILGSAIGGSDGDGDIVITITGVSPNPSVYESYTCHIFERQGGNKRLSYYDSSDILTIKDINE